MYINRTRKGAKSFQGIWLPFIIFTIFTAVTCELPAQSDGKIPLIWCTDLFHPHQDPDDHLDLITVFSMPEFDVLAILLDQGAKQTKEPGSLVVEQMMALTGHRVAYAAGLADKLKSIDDKGEDQDPAYQSAIELFLSTLRKSRKPVQVIVAGSLRDVAAAYNREPELVREKVAMLHINIGNAALKGEEWNVNLDPFAYRQILESGLPISWYPCKPYYNSKSSHFLLKRYGDVFDQAPIPLQNFIIYALNRVDPAEIEPINALGMDLRPWRQLIWGREKDMWCTASIIHAAGRKIYKLDGEWMTIQGPPPEGAVEMEVFTMVPARIQVDQKGFTERLDYDATDPNVVTIQSKDYQQYTEAMTGCLKYLFKHFPSGMK